MEILSDKQRCGKKLTKEEAIHNVNVRCQEKNYEFIEFVGGNYDGVKTKLKLKCQNCGNVWESTSYEKFIYANRGCPNCSKSKKLTEDEIKNEINNLCKEKDLTFLGFKNGFKGAKSKLMLKCNKCGDAWESTTYINFKKQNRKSHTCGRKNPKFMPSNFNESKAKQNIINAIQGSSLEFISFDENGYIGNRQSKVLLKCKKCGKINIFTYRYVIQHHDITCKFCEFGGKYSDEYARQIVEEKCKFLNYTFLGFNTDDGMYNGKRTYLKLKCNVCGYEWQTTRFGSFSYNIIKCMGCLGKTWKMEKEIEYVLNKENIEYIKHARFDWLKSKASLSLDFYMPKLNIAIECQGRQHYSAVADFGGQQAFKDGRFRDIKKKHLCKKNGVKLLYYDSETRHKKFLGENVFKDKDSVVDFVKSNFYGQEN